MKIWEKAHEKLCDDFEINVNGIKTFHGTGVGLHVSSVYGIPFIPTKKEEPKPIQVLNIFEKIYGLKPKDNPTIILTSTPNSKKGFFYEKCSENPLDINNYGSIFGAVAWSKLNLEANTFAELPKYAWESPNSIDKIVGDNTEKCDPWGSLAQLRIYSANQMKELSTRMICEAINRPKINFKHV